MLKLILLYPLTAILTSNSVNGIEVDVFQGPYKCSCGTKINEYKDFFSTLLDNLHCCRGNPYCERSAQLEESGKPDLLLCVSEKSCIVKPSSGHSHTCHNTTDDCFIDSLTVYNISNIFKEWSLYNCILVNKDPFPLCLIPACKTFGAVERNCFCSNVNKSCVCYSSAFENEVVHLETDISTYAIFISFGEDFITAGNTKFSTITILVILFSCIFLLGLLGMLLKGIHIFSPALSSGHTQAACSASIRKFCCRSRNVTSNNNSLARPASAVPKVAGIESQADTQNEHVLPTYEQAVSQERTIYTVELPPTYGDVTT